MWSPGLFAELIFLQDSEILTVDLPEGDKGVATLWFFQRLAAFVQADTESPGDILPHDGRQRKMPGPTAAHRASPLSSTFGEAGVCLPYVAGRARRQEAKVEERWGVDPRRKTNKRSRNFVIEFVRALLYMSIPRGRHVLIDVRV